MTDLKAGNALLTLLHPEPLEGGLGGGGEGHEVPVDAGRALHVVDDLHPWPGHGPHTQVPGAWCAVLVGTGKPVVICDISFPFILGCLTA